MVKGSTSNGLKCHIYMWERSWNLSCVFAMSPACMIDACRAQYIKHAAQNDCGLRSNPKEIKGDIEQSFWLPETISQLPCGCLGMDRVVSMHAL